MNQKFFHTIYETKCNESISAENFKRISLFFLSQEQEEWMQVLRLVCKQKPIAREKPLENPISIRAYKIIFSKWFEPGIMSMILINVL